MKSLLLPSVSKGSRELGVGSRELRGSSQRNAKSPDRKVWASYKESGSVLLSHGECRTIIGAKVFHGPVRDGKGWDHLAMAARHKLFTN